MENKVISRTSDLGHPDLSKRVLGSHWRRFDRIHRSRWRRFDRVLGSRCPWQESTVDWTQFDRFWPAMHDVMRYLSLEDRFSTARVFQWSEGLSGGWNAIDLTMITLKENGKYQYSIPHPSEYSQIRSFYENYPYRIAITPNNEFEVNIVIDLSLEVNEDLYADWEYDNRNDNLVRCYNCNSVETDKIFKPFQPLQVMYFISNYAPISLIWDQMNWIVDSVEEIQITWVDQDTTEESRIASSKVEINFYKLLTHYPNTKNLNISNFHYEIVRNFQYKNIFPSVNQLQVFELDLDCSGKFEVLYAGDSDKDYYCKWELVDSAIDDVRQKIRLRYGNIDVRNKRRDAEEGRAEMYYQNDDDW